MRTDGAEQQLIAARGVQAQNAPAGDQHHPLPLKLKIGKILVSRSPLLLLLLLFIFIYFFIALPDKGMTAIFNCRFFATIAAFLMIASFVTMIYQWCKEHPVVNREKGQISHIMQLFLCIGAATTFYGYYNHISFIRIYWQYDFALRYQKNKELENIQDCFYIVSVLFFLLFLLNYLLRVAPVVGIPTKVKWVLLITLFLNAAQKWLFESIDVHMEMCEELNKNESKAVCETYIHYHTSTKNLSKPQKWLYYSSKGVEPLTYTITMELFIACMAIVIHLSHHENHATNDKQQEITPRDEQALQEAVAREEQVLREIVSRDSTPRMWITFIICCVGLIVTLLWIIHLAPVLYVYPFYLSHRIQRVSVRMGTHVFNSVLAFACSWNFGISGIFKVWEKPFPWVEKDADIIILWFAFVMHCCIFVLKFIFEIFSLPSLDILYWIDQIGTLFEIFSFYLLILVAERLLLVAKTRNLENNNKNFVKFFILIYSCIALLGFVAYYNLKTLHQFPRDVKEGWKLNMLVLLQSTYPSTLLFTMTVGFCFATVGEEFYRNGFYTFVPKRTNQPINAAVAV